MKHTYKARAEIPSDTQFLLNGKFRVDNIELKTEGYGPDCVIEFSSYLTLREIKKLCKKFAGIGAHVLLETLAYKSKYTGKRTYKD
jgi:hypothetical protein